MITLVLHLLRLLPFLCAGQRQLALENLALRQQLAVYKRTVPRPRWRTMDRLVWVGLASVWAGWRQALVIVSPDTVLRWQRRRFREHWTRRSGRPRPGRPPISAETAALIRTMAATNPSWGAPRIHGELLKLVEELYGVASVLFLFTQGLRLARAPRYLSRPLKQQQKISEWHDRKIEPALRAKMDETPVPPEITVGEGGGSERR
jgi:hypothetical protein